MWRHVASNALTFFIVLLFLAAGAIAWGSKQYESAGPLEQAICLRVESGSNMRRVSKELADQGAISSPAIFRIGADYSERADRLKAGSFLVSEGASMAEIIEAITATGQSTCGTEIVYRVGITKTQVQVRELDPVTDRFVELVEFDLTDAVPAEYAEVREQSDTRFRIAMAEGVTSWQVMDALNNLDALDGQIPAVPAEGSLAPDSYAFVPGDDANEVIARMTEAQEEILRTAWQSRADGLPIASVEEALVLASIVEKETGVPEERFEVASVFINRLNRGMKLQTDPTVIYGITKGEGILGRGIRQSELRRETPWNTYVIDGLPPTPIANPGRASIEAALNPDTTEYIFFVADGTGGHAFATNLDDHNRNVAAYRKIEAERASAEGN